MGTVTPVYTGERRERQPTRGRGTPTGMLAWPRMARIRVLFESGEPERVIEFDPRKAPFQHDGRPGSILDVLLAHGVPLEHACGGNCACTTCHVVVKQGLDAHLTEADDDELDRVDMAADLTPHSRLG